VSFDLGVNSVALLRARSNPMKRLIVQAILGVVLAGGGWALGAAQTRAGDFELRIDAPAGATRVECLRGCGLIGIRDLPGPAVQMRVYDFDCNAVDRCQATVAGFLQK
jgi:hypothetical protein